MGTQNLEDYSKWKQLKYEIRVNVGDLAEEIQQIRSGIHPQQYTQKENNYEELNYKFKHYMEILRKINSIDQKRQLDRIDKLADKMKY